MLSLPDLIIYAAIDLAFGAVLLLFLVGVTGAIFGNLDIGYVLGWIGRGFGLMAVLVAVDITARLFLPPGLSSLLLNLVVQVCLLTAGLMLVYRLASWHAAVVALLTVFLCFLFRLAVVAVLTTPPSLV